MTGLFWGSASSVKTVYGRPRGGFVSRATRVRCRVCPHLAPGHHRKTVTSAQGDMDSDTEAESQASVGGWDATEFAHIATTQALCSSEDGSQLDAKLSGADVEQAVHDLQSLDLEAVAKVVAAKGSYLHFLTYVCRMNLYTMLLKLPRQQFSLIWSVLAIPRILKT